MDNIQRIYSFSQRFSDDDLDNNNIQTKKFIFCISFLDDMTQFFLRINWPVIWNEDTILAPLILEKK